VALVTTAQVLDVTGREVDDDQILRAQFVVDLIGDVDLEDPKLADKMRPRDLALLRRAVCYQTPWQAAQIDYEETVDVLRIAGSTSTGGIELRDEFSLLLAPLARQSLSRVSWKRRKWTNLRPRRDRVGSYGLCWAGVTVSHDPMDTYGQLDNALHDAGPWSDD